MPSDIDDGPSYKRRRRSPVHSRETTCNVGQVSGTKANKSASTQTIHPDTEYLSPSPADSEVTPLRRRPGRPMKSTLSSGKLEVSDDKTHGRLVKPAEDRKSPVRDAENQTQVFVIAPDQSMSRRSLRRHTARSSSITHSAVETRGLGDVDNAEMLRKLPVLTSSPSIPLDSRKRHASGKPMGRPRKSDPKIDPDGTVKIEDETKEFSDTLDEVIQDATPRPANKRRVGRPRKGPSNAVQPIKDCPDVLLDGMISSSVLRRTRRGASDDHHKANGVLSHSSPSHRSGPRRIKLTFGTHTPDKIVTHPLHVAQLPRFSSLGEFLDSYVSLDEDLDLESAQAHRRSRHALKQRIEEAREHGTLDKAPRPVAALQKSDGPTSSPYHQDELVAQARHFAKLMQEERKRNFSNARKIGTMIQTYFKRLSGADERQYEESQKFIRQLAKRTSNEVRRKWRLAEKELQRRIGERLQDEQRAAGKEHLKKILEHSTTLLDARISSKLEDQSFTDAVSEGDDDHYLSIEQLRIKYANVPDIIPHFGSSPFEGTAPDDRAPSLMSSAQHSSQSCTESSPMDSEDDAPDSYSSDAGDSDSPDLSSLYPEIQRSVSRLDAIGKDDETHDKSDIANNGHSSVIPRTELGHRQRTPAPLAGLPSDDEMHDLENDSPMDSEMDEDDSETSGVSNSDDGPGLSWLYSDAIPNGVAQEQAASSQVISPKCEIRPSSTSQSIGEQFLPSPDAVSQSPKHSKTPIPVLLRGTLREYQHAGLDWLAGLYSNGTNGILADEMGLGKTIQTISLLTWLACDRHIWGSHLIIVPTSVMLNWEMEFKKFAPGLKVLTYYGNPKERKEKRRGWSKEDAVHVIITSYQLVITDAAVFRRKRWEYMILDEAHNIKNFKSQRWQTLLNFNARHRLLLTGTPLQNNLNELWSLLYFLMPNGLSTDASFANLADFQEWFSRPVDKLIEQGDQELTSESRHTVAKLHTILRPYILRRLKADVEKQMPGKFEHVIDCRLSKRQRYLYDDFMSRSGTKAIMASGNFLSIINCFMQLRKVCNHPDLFESRPIVTSLAVKNVVASYAAKEVSVRRNLLSRCPFHQVNLDFLNLKLALGNRNSKALESTISRLALQLLTKEQCTMPSPESSQSFTALQRSILAQRSELEKISRDQKNNYINGFRCSRTSLYGSEVLFRLQSVSKNLVLKSAIDLLPSALTALLPSFASFCQLTASVVRKFACITPKVVALGLPSLAFPLPQQCQWELRAIASDPTFYARTATSIAFPDKRLLQFDCGKLQRLDRLLRELIGQGHRILIFTQMTKMLDILEQFLNIHGHRYFRLDGSTKIELRQSLTERFNSDTRIPIFILSTRSGGLGINLTGADTVIFYDSDWNPCMDRQCQDRAHRIGQTRDVHIYRFVSEYTIEQNIMRKANQKRMLDNVVIGEGDFTTDFFSKVDWKDMLGGDIPLDINSAEKLDLENVLAAVEDEDDVEAAKCAQREMDTDAVEFTESSLTEAHVQDGADHEVDQFEGPKSPAQRDDCIGSVEEYMILFLERDTLCSNR